MTMTRRAFVIGSSAAAAVVLATPIGTAGVKRLVRLRPVIIDPHPAGHVFALPARPQRVLAVYRNGPCGLRVVVWPNEGLAAPWRITASETFRFQPPLAARDWRAATRTDVLAGQAVLWFPIQQRDFTNQPHTLWADVTA